MRGLKTVRALAAAIVFATLAACASGGMPAAATGQQAPAVVAPAESAYPLGSGDKLRITVFNEDRLTGEYSVTGGGEISFPLIGNVTAAGQTIEALRETLRSRLAAGYLRDPKVSVEVLNYRPYYILGEVGKAGEYPFVIGLTVQQAVATAGGYTYRANTRRVFIKRALDTREQQIELRNQDPVPVRPGDTIRVGERFF